MMNESSVLSFVFYKLKKARPVAPTSSQQRATSKHMSGHLAAQQSSNGRPTPVDEPRYEPILHIALLLLRASQIGSENKS
jgi:hypothetical protein